MKDYLNVINNNYPIRRTKEEKECFREYIKNEVNKNNYSCVIETLDKTHNNIIIGDIEKAEVIFTAHYDTPALSIIPNLMLPRNKGLAMLYHLGFPILLSILSLVISYFISYLISNDIKLTVALYLFLYLSSFFLLTRCFSNKNNKNDNTSGVATILELTEKINKDSVAFILFDNEEKGLLGSKAFSKEHKKLIEKKLFINFDCVGFGNNIIFIAKDGALNHKLYPLLQNKVIQNEEYNVYFYPFKGSFANSDYKNFECGIGVMSCKNKKNIFYTNNIHTNKDVYANEKNIEFIINKIMKFIDEEL